MAVQEQTPYIEHIANGVTTSFALEFECKDKEHLIVLVDNVEPNVGTWSLVNGAVVFGIAPENGKIITIQRNTPFRRDTNFQSYDNSLRPATINKDFDWIWYKLQELGVADWILGSRIDALKNYVDDRDDELRAYLMEEIRKQGVALDQLDEYYNYLMQRLAQIAVSRGWDASFIADAGGSTQQDINDFGGAKWRNKAGGYALGATVKLDNGDVVKSLVNWNTNNPNVNTTGWDFNYKRVNIGAFTNPSTDKLNRLVVGEIFETSGYYENGDNGRASYVVKLGNTTENSYSFNIDGLRYAELVATKKNRLEQYGIILADKSSDNTSLSDYSDNLQDAVDHANLLTFNYGKFRITKTINVSRNLKIKGFFHNSILYADMPTKTTAIFNVVTDGAVFNSFVCRGNASRNGEFAVFSGTVGVPSYAANNKFNYIKCENIALFNRFTTVNPLDGALHAMGSENLFYGCKVYNCDKYIIAENTQSVNNWWRSCDFERDDASDNASNNYIEDFAGSGLNFQGGSIIGRGTIYTFEYPMIGQGLFAGGNLSMSGVRFECRAEHSGFLIKQGTSGKVDVTLYLKINLSDCSIVANKKISVLSYCGRVVASINNITSVNGVSLTVNQFPTIGASVGSMELGSYGSVDISSSTIEFIKENYSPYGTYNESFTGSCSIDSVLPSTTNETSYSDSDGFIVNKSMPINQLGVGVNYIRENTFAFGFDGSNMQFSTTPYLFRLAKGMRLRRFGFTKMQNYRDSEIIAKLYFVKDKSQWSGSTFNIATDAILLSEVNCPVGSVGYFESRVAPTQDLNASAALTGFGNWLECRIAMVLNAQTTGVLTIDYI